VGITSRHSGARLWPRARNPLTLAQAVYEGFVFIGSGHAAPRNSGMTNLLLCQTPSPPQADAADRHCDRRLGWFDDRDLDGLFEIAAVARHPGAPHDEHVGTVLVAQPAADIDHASQGRAL